MIMSTLKQQAVKMLMSQMTKAVPVRFSLPLNKLEPGRYTCQVTVMNPSAQRFAFWRAPIALLP